MAFQALINWLLPKDDKFFTMLEEHASVLAEAAHAMTRFPETADEAAAAVAAIHQLEHRGDDLMRALVLALDETFVTPIDREDLHNLATALDNVLDYTYHAAQAFIAYDVQKLTPAMREMIGLLGEAAGVLKEAVPRIRLHSFDKLAPARLQIVALEKRSDAIYQSEMAMLFKDPAIDAKTLLRQQAVLDALEAAMDSCQDATDVLENVAIKHA